MFWYYETLTCVTFYQHTSKCNILHFQNHFGRNYDYYTSFSCLQPFKDIYLCSQDSSLYSSLYSSQDSRLCSILNQNVWLHTIKSNVSASHTKHRILHPICSKFPEYSSTDVRSSKGVVKIWNSDRNLTYSIFRNMQR